MLATIGATAPPPHDEPPGWHVAFARLQLRGPSCKSSARCHKASEALALNPKPYINPKPLKRVQGAGSTTAAHTRPKSED